MVEQVTLYRAPTTEADTGAIANSLDELGVEADPVDLTSRDAPADE